MFALLGELKLSLGFESKHHHRHSFEHGNNFYTIYFGHISDGVLKEVVMDTRQNVALLCHPLRVSEGLVFVISTLSEFSGMYVLYNT